MYRTSHESLARNVAELEQELAEMRGLSRSPRWRMRALAAVTSVSVLSSLLLGVACASSHARAERLQVHMSEAARILDSRAADIATCETLVESQERAAAQCRVGANLDGRF